MLVKKREKNVNSQSKRHSVKRVEFTLGNG